MVETTQAQMIKQLNSILVNLIDELGPTKKKLIDELISLDEKKSWQSLIVRKAGGIAD